MALKRKRNLRIDAGASYSVFFSGDLDPDETEDYVEARDTGMEADEEKEVHLQDIIKGEKKDIPLPVIAEVENVSRSFFGPRKLRRHIAWERDCKNTYIENKEDLEEEARVIRTEPSATKERGPAFPGEDPDHRHLDSALGNGLAHGRREGAMPQDLFELVGRVSSDKSCIPNRSDAVVDFCLRRSIARYERRGYEAYTCFRDRIFRPTFKSRRSEALVVEKLERMGTELETLGVMCSLLKEKCILELKALKKTTRVLEVISSIRMNRTKKKALRRLMVEGPAKSPPPLSLHGIMTNRDRIMAMRNLRVSPELYLDIKYYSETMELVGKPEEFEQRNRKICRTCFDNRPGNGFDSSA